MACNGDGYPPSERELWFAAAFPAACEMSKLLDKKQRRRLSLATKSWVVEHLRYDAEQKAQQAAAMRLEKIADAARRKLTPEEREVLGVD